MGADLFILILLILLGIIWLLVASLMWYFSEQRWVSKWMKLDKMHDSGNISIEEYDKLWSNMKSDCPDELWDEVLRMYNLFKQG
jgi:hypothetical protein